MVPKIIELMSTISTYTSCLMTPYTQEEINHQLVNLAMTYGVILNYVEPSPVIAGNF